MKEIVVFSNLDASHLEALKNLKDKISLDHSRLHLVHCLKVEAYSYDFLTAYYPTERDLESLKKAAGEVLNDQKEKLVAGDSTLQFTSEVLTSPSPKEECVDYLKNVKADLAVVVTKERHGLNDIFHSSFSSFLNSHSPCDVFVLRD